ncbi:hypothetical protein X758_29705 [Mesorhizobium sp. LSHC416B00]|nr:hypothetical protein X758_29705 [Mesorhizobium sp. LSHC416B00]
MGVGISSAIRWIGRGRRGETTPRPEGRRRGSRLDADADFIVGMIEERKDITLNEVEQLLAERFMLIGLCGDTAGRLKKVRTRTGANRPDILKRRRAWFDGQLDLDPAKLVFIDEAGLSTRWLACAEERRAANAAGQACHTPLEDHDPHRRAQADRNERALRLRRRHQRGRVPRLCQAGASANPGARRRRRHGQFAGAQVRGMREAIEAAGARLIFLPPYSPDFNPIENAFAKLKALLPARAERTIPVLWGIVGALVDLYAHRMRKLLQGRRL